MENNAEGKEHNAKGKHGMIEEIFETILFQSRFIVLIPVVGTLLAALVMFFKGCIEIIQGVSIFLTKFSGFTPNPADDKYLILSIIPALDNYLFATVLLIISLGLYELFISKVDPSCRKDTTPPAWLSIKEWDELNTHVGQVIIMILIVNFFRLSYDVVYDHPIDLLILGCGIILIAGSLIITHSIIHVKKIKHQDK